MISKKLYYISILSILCLVPLLSIPSASAVIEDTYTFNIEENTKYIYHVEGPSVPVEYSAFEYDELKGTTQVDLFGGEDEYNCRSVLGKMYEWDDNDIEWDFMNPIVTFGAEPVLVSVNISNEILMEQLLPFPIFLPIVDLPDILIDSMEYYENRGSITIDYADALNGNVTVGSDTLLQYNYTEDGILDYGRLGTTDGNLTVQFTMIESADLPSNTIPNGTIETTQDGLTTTFSYVSNVNVEEYDLVWDFGDGSDLSTEESPQHTYETEGEYDVTLYVEDQSEDKLELSITITVKKPFPYAIVFGSLGGVVGIGVIFYFLRRRKLRTPTINKSGKKVCAKGRELVNGACMKISQPSTAISVKKIFRTR